MSSNDENLVDYVFGTCSPQQPAALENVAMKEPPFNQDKKQALEVIDELAKAIVPLKPSEGVKQRLLLSISNDSAFSGFNHRLSQFFDLSIQAVEKILEVARQGPNEIWETMVLDGIYLYHLEGGPNVSTADCGLVYLESGISFPLHRHLGDEIALILQGEILEDSGEIRSVGDEVLRVANSQHGFKVISKEPVILAIVLHKGFEFITS